MRDHSKGFGEEINVQKLHFSRKIQNCVQKKKMSMGQIVLSPAKLLLMKQSGQGLYYVLLVNNLEYLYLWQQSN